MVEPTCCSLNKIKAHAGFGLDQAFEAVLVSAVEASVSVAAAEIRRHFEVALGEERYRFSKSPCYEL